MASVSMIEARAYLGIDGTDHDIYLTGMRRESERRVRRLTIIGDMVDDMGVYTHQFPSDLQPAQLIIIKWMFDRRENPEGGLSPPALYGLIDGWERGVGNPNEQEVRVHQPSVTPEPPPEPFFFLGWTQAPPAVGFDMDLAQALAQVITQDDFDHAARADGNGPLTWPMAHFVANAANGWGYYWIAVEEGRGEPPGGTQANGINQGTGLTANGTMGFTDTESGLPLEFWIWPTALNVNALGDGSRYLVLLGYPA